MVSVVVPVKDDAQRLRLLLAALASQDYGGEVQIIVADNGSSSRDGVDVARAAGAVVVEEPQGGSYSARNAALVVATGDVVAFTDADCLPRPGWLTAAVSALEGAEGHGPVAVAGPIRVFARDPCAPTLGEAWDVMRGLPQERYVQDGWAATANLVVRRDVLEEVGHFDPRLRSGGDNEWGRRAGRAGVRFLVTREAVVEHPARRDLGELARKLRRVHQGAAERAARGGGPVPSPLRALAVALRPPVGATRAAFSSERLPSVRARLAFVLAEVIVRWMSVWFALAVRPSSGARPASGGAAVPSAPLDPPPTQATERAHGGPDLLPER